MELSCTPNGKLDQTTATSTAYMYMYMIPSYQMIYHSYVIFCIMISFPHTNFARNYRDYKYKIDKHIL